MMEILALLFFAGMLALCVGAIVVSLRKPSCNPAVRGCKRGTCFVCRQKRQGTFVPAPMSKAKREEQ